MPEGPPAPSNELALSELGLTPIAGQPGRRRRKHVRPVTRVAELGHAGKLSPRARFGGWALGGLPYPDARGSGCWDGRPASRGCNWRPPACARGPTAPAQQTRIGSLPGYDRVRAFWRRRAAAVVARVMAELRERESSAPPITRRRLLRAPGRRPLPNHARPRLQPRLRPHPRRRRPRPGQGTARHSKSPRIGHRSAMRGVEEHGFDEVIAVALNETSRSSGPGPFPGRPPSVCRS